MPEILGKHTTRVKLNRLFPCRVVVSIITKLQKADIPITLSQAPSHSAQTHIYTSDCMHV